MLQTTHLSTQTIQATQTPASNDHVEVESIDLKHKRTDLDVRERLRIATWNIHKGVCGWGPMRRLEIHNLASAIRTLQTDLVFLQEVRSFNNREALRFAQTSLGWPDQPQADFLAPEGYTAAYRTNAFTKDGEHGNALLSRLPMGEIGHHDVSDHRFEQRGLLHVPVRWQGTQVHAIVAHFGLIHSSRVRQVKKLAEFVEQNVPPDEPVLVAGDFNDWGEKLDKDMKAIGLHRASCQQLKRAATFPARWPVFTLDRAYIRGLECVATEVPRGPGWQRMSDHLPLVMEFELESN